MALYQHILYINYILNPNFSTGAGYPDQIGPALTMCASEAVNLSRSGACIVVSGINSICASTSEKGMMECIYMPFFLSTVQ